MRYMLLRRSDPAHEAGAPFGQPSGAPFGQPFGQPFGEPSGEPFPASEREALAAYTREMDEAGILHACEHLLPSASGVRMTIADGRASVSSGPFLDAQGLLAGFAVIDVPSREDALAWAARWPAGAGGDGGAVVEVRLSGCPGGCAQVRAAAEPDAPGQRYAILLRSSSDLENETPVERARLDALDAHNAAEANAGVLLGADGLRASFLGARVKLAAGKLTVVDGPFTEIKEMIAGYWLIRAPSLQDAIAWATRNPYPVGPPVEVEIRQVAELADAADMAGADRAADPVASVTPAGQHAHQRVRQPAGGPLPG